MIIISMIAMVTIMAMLVRMTNFSMIAIITIALMTI